MKELTTKQAISARRSIRRFKPDPVPAEHVTQLLEAARLAPSGSNSQPWRFKIVTAPAGRSQSSSCPEARPYRLANPSI